MPSNAQYYTDCFNGNMFIGSTAVAGIKPPAYNATAHTYCIWNPLGSPKNVVLVSMDVGYSDTTSAAGNFTLSYQTGVGAQVASGGAITAATLVAPVNALLSAGNSSVVKFAPATATFAAATTLLLTLGWSQLVTTATTTSSIGWTQHYEFNGKLIIPPGTAVCLTGNTAVLSNCDVTTFWVETPLSG